MISLKHHFLYVHVPKTAGNAVQNLLRRYSEDRVVCLAPHQDGVELVGRRFAPEIERFGYSFSLVAT